MKEPRISHVLMLMAGLMLVLLLTGAAEAACGGSSPNRVAASASRADALDCVNASVSGDTITVPAGTATWSSPVPLPATKDISVIGSSVINCTGTPGTASYNCAATNNTNLSCPFACFELSMAASQRISGFTMSLPAGSSDELISCVDEVNPAKHFRIDHNRFVATVWAPIRCKGQQNGIHPQGIWDHNRLENVAIHTNGTLWQFEDGTGQYQHVIWADPPTYGGSSRVVYIEANHWSASQTNATDGNYGCRYIARFNRVEGASYWAFEVHGMQGPNRGCQQAEVYHNALTSNGGGLSELRGGSGVYFNNAASAGVPSNINLTIDRSEYDEPAGNFNAVRECGVGGASGNGPAGVDQQTSGQNGWRCRDQVGISHDATKWSHSPANNPTSFGAWNQVTRPVYVWSNTAGGSPIGVTANTQGDIEAKIVIGREVFCDAGGFPGSCNNGVRVGTIAARPATCTTGQAYWATDEGEWNSLQSGPDGRLYQCSATNTWSLFYTPFQYPHPWAGGGGGTNATPSAPPTVQVN